MKSMTGFGEASAENQTYRVGVTARSVNHRFLDVLVRLPDEHRSLESTLAETVRSRVMRGRVELRVSIEPLGERQVEVELREDLVRQLLDRLEVLRSEGRVEGPVKIGDLVRIPQVLAVRESPPDWTELDDELVHASAERALTDLVARREHEGEALARVLLGKLDELDGLVAALEARRHTVIAEIRTALEQRIADLLADATIPEERLAQEAVLLVERGDVREELDRLSGHLDHFRTMAAGEGPHGRRLEFVVQEIQRELNTLGSKCRDAEMSRAVVEGKVHCEQLREQLLNVE